MKPDLLEFDEGYFKRIWGGRKLETVCGKPIPAEEPIGEAWLISDHPEHVSKVVGGALDGRSLSALVKEDAEWLLGRRAKPTVHGQFPLLLKILDAADYLSVQVHPDDAAAERLGEPDVGKTEMWHVLESEPGSELICGMPPGVTRETFAAALEEKRLGEILTRFPVDEGTSVFVAAGTVHAIGPGILLAEIQQNSNITYRVYDWDRVQADGTSRELHVERSLDVTHFGSTHAGANSPLRVPIEGGERSVLAVCRYFAAELVTVTGRVARVNGGETFHVLLGKTGDLELRASGASMALGPTLALGPTRAALVVGAAEGFEVHGDGSYLDYYVPDLRLDIVEALRDAGHTDDAIVRLGGDPKTSDLAEFVQ